MIKMNKIATGLAASVLLVSVAQAQETVNSQATATVQNAFTLEETTAITFGTLRATAGATGDAATLVISANPTVAAVSTPGGTVASLDILEEGAPGEYAVSGVSPFSSLTIDMPSDTDVVLVGASLPAGSPTLIASAWNAYVLTGPNENTVYASSNLRADAGGVVTFSVGATLTTEIVTAAAAYLDAEYSASYDITVSY